jgi:hypothetical protein
MFDLEENGPLRLNLRLKDFVYHSSLGLQAIKKKKDKQRTQSRFKRVD